MTREIPPIDSEVARVMDAYPASIRTAIMQVRQLIFETAAATSGVGPLTETLKWGEPAYLTTKTKAGSTIRLGWKASTPSRYAIYFNCRTTLVDAFRTLFPDEFKYQGNRAIVFDEGDTLPRAQLGACIAMALNYHLSREKNKK